MKCGSCIYYEEDVCYKKGARVSYNNNICESYIKIVNLDNEYRELLKK